MTQQIALATQNKGKIAEFQRLLAEHTSSVEVLGLAEFPDMPDVDETGTTFAENSLLKARAVSAFTGIPALADDSGLCIDFLGGAPGIYSARYAGSHGNDGANIAKVLAELQNEEQRSAHFICVVAMTFPVGHKNHGTEIIQEGKLQGSIVQQPRGTAGFGYDPIFCPDGYELTLGEFGPGEKDRISHRGKALRAIAPQISGLLS
ncbi:MAG: RdgB/HAM1 family non-canonical purine NTP pyrophosphatase [Actinobacteria bacterium]|uniref:dITP/XTP pyrophosphatase n=1 Tax=freshwater metagenome TaxID=449393 RepID=A0A6J6ASA2_9ZZZZ|nr:RdgB/HAM1 family non-canonical purine NTP pyrophosphatase [Actinomycetota bacterium]